MWCSWWVLDRDEQTRVGAMPALIMVSNKITCHEHTRSPVVATRLLDSDYSVKLPGKTNVLLHDSSSSRAAVAVAQQQIALYALTCFKMHTLQYHSSKQPLLIPARHQQTSQLPLRRHAAAVPQALPKRRRHLRRKQKEEPKQFSDGEHTGMVEALQQVVHPW